MLNQSISPLFEVWGTVTRIVSGAIEIEGVSSFACVGDEIEIRKPGRKVLGEVLSVTRTQIMALLYSTADDVHIGDVAYIRREATVRVSDDWLGEIVNYRGEIHGGTQPASSSPIRQQLYAPAPQAHLRRSLGARLRTGYMVTDTLLPVCKGQRVGLFAGSGVGKSTLLGNLSRNVAADRIVIALIGERSREVIEFARKTLTPELQKKAVIVAATSSEPPGAKKRAAYTAMAAAEHFRDAGHDVLFVFDSLTRFAEAHRETALMAGEQPALNAFPPSTNRVIAELTERAGPGIEGQGDITGIFSVLVAGSDMEEPVTDMIRGILDGHIVLARDIAERGRYPAIDVARSVSRALPGAASADENQLLHEYRRMLTLYEEVAPMLRANLYEFGQDKETDRAVKLYARIDHFVSQKNEEDPAAAFDLLRRVLQPENAATDNEPSEAIIPSDKAA